MAEWLKAHAWKACLPQGNVGSNPTLSAIQDQYLESSRLNKLKSLQYPEGLYFLFGTPLSPVFYPKIELNQAAYPQHLYTRSGYAIEQYNNLVK